METQIDDIQAPSITKKEPEYSINNVFKPTPKNKIISGMLLKIVSIGLIGLGTTLFGLIALVPTLVHTLVITGIFLNLFGIFGGATGELLILLTKEEPLSTLVRAAEDIKLDAVKAVELQTEQTQQIEQPHD